MAARLIGLETEYAVAALGGDGRYSAANGCAALMRTAHHKLTHVPGVRDDDMFLQNGSRVYPDANSHPEFCTPEVNNPDDLVLYWLAGEAILRDLASQHADAEIVLYKCNVDYGTGQTWGCHENYLHRATATLPRQFIPYLVSRVCLCAGGLNPFCPGIQFTLSPRLHFFSTPTLDVTMSNGVVSTERGIFNPRDEPLASGGYHRLHIVCADSVCSHVALWLRVSSACLVLAMAECGLDVGGAVQFQDPVSALACFLTDPHFKATAPLIDGRQVTALEVQSHYLEQAEAHLDHDCMPSWAAQTCERWREMLDLLQRGPEAVALKLDWAIKHALFMNHIRLSGIDPESLPYWNHVLERVCRAAPKRRRGRVDADMILNSGLRRSDPGDLRIYMHEHGLCWDQVRPVLDLRDELCEIDMRFGQIFPAGIFDALEPMLEHRLPGIDQIDEAKSTPPQGTRARLRGDTVRKRAGKPGYHADWCSIQDARGRVLDLSDPFTRSAQWSKEERRDRTVDRLQLVLDRVYCEYEKGGFEKAYRIIRSGMRQHTNVHPVRCYQLARYLAWVQSRRGNSLKAISVLDDCTTGNANDQRIVRDKVVVYRFRALAPLESDVREWIQRGDALFHEWSAPMVIADFLGNKGSVLARTGSLHEAADVLRGACAIEEIETTHLRLRARIMADMADVCRILGARGEAAGWLDKVDRIHQFNDFPGERADFALTYRAKLEDDTSRARELLTEAARIQKRLSNHIGLARTLLLDARLAPSKSTATRRRKTILELRERVHDLRRCPRLRQILSRWDRWANRGSGSENGDYFWLL